MTKDTHTTEVKFRKFKDGQIIALMPHEVCDLKGNVTSYMHVGQHSGADYKGMLAITKRATPTEYEPLLNELESIGYRIKLVQKQFYKKYLESYYEVRK